MQMKTKFISDTYPLEHNLQTLFEYDINTNVQKEIVEAYSSPLLYGEQRCDMHPRLLYQENISHLIQRILIIEEKLYF